MSSIKFYTWQQHIINISPRSTGELVFNGTQPNVFYVENMGEETAYISMSYIPSEKRYDKKVKGGNSDAFGRPMSTSRLYFYNPSESFITLHVFSDKQDFDISLLKKLSAELEGEISLPEVSVTTDGIIKGVSEGVTIPVEIVGGSTGSGTSEDDGIIKGVSEGVTIPVSSELFENMVTSLNSIKSSLSNIQSDRLMPITADMKSGTVTEATTITYTFYEIVFITNDGTEDLIISVNCGSGTVAEIILKAGETIQNIKLLGLGISFAGNNINARYCMLKGFN